VAKPAGDEPSVDLQGRMYRHYTGAIPACTTIQAVFSRQHQRSGGHMAIEMCADPVELARAAGTSQVEARALAEDLVTYRGHLALFEGAFGKKYDNSHAGFAFFRYNQDFQAAMVTIERIITVLEEESDGLYETAFVCKAVDEEAARDLANVSPDAGPAPV
jgi:hypothetical protein